MIIAVNTRLRKAEQPEGYEAYLFGLLGALAQKYTEHQFIFIFDRLVENKPVFPKNVLPVVAGPETSTRLRLQYWLNYKIPVVLRKYKANVFLSLEGNCSMRTKKPQCVLVSDLSFLQPDKRERKSRAGFYKKYSASFLARANSLVAVSDFTKEIMVSQYHLNPSAIALAEPGIDDGFKPLDWKEQDLVREKYTGGKAYFLYVGAVNGNSNTINLLKAFSFFKKRQKSNMQLIIAGNAGEMFKKELKTYKLRSDLILLEDLPTVELAKITAAAYALVFPLTYADFAIAPVQALKCGVPLIVSRTGALPGIFGDTALYCDPGNFEDIAETMMRVFKEEDQARLRVLAGKTLAEQFSWDKSAEILMQSIEQAYNS